MSSKLSSANKKVIDTIEIPAFKYTILTLIVLSILFISKIPTEYLAVYDSMWVRAIVALIIAWTACFDPVFSVAIATKMIFAIQELHRRRAVVTMKSDVKAIVVPPNVVGNHTMPTIPAEIAASDKLVFDEINKHSLQKIPEGDDTILAEYDFYFDPAYTNLTQNVREQNILRNGSFYVTTEELQAAQSNQAVGGGSGAMTALPGSLNAQGMNSVIPSGYDKEMYSLDVKELAL